MDISIMKVALISAALVSVTLAAARHPSPPGHPSPAPGHDEVQFARFREQFGKTYHVKAEFERRFTVFQQNLRKYEQHNKSGASWTMGVNQFSDLTDEEFETQHMGGYKKTPGMTTATRSLAAPTKRAAQLPESVDWREKGAISPVKDQQACGSCWAFCATAMIESYAQITEGGDVPILSAQQVTACTPNPLSCGGTGGCMGSIPQLAFTYIQLFGHVTEDEWPYTAGSGNTGSCEYDFNGMPPSVGLTGYQILEANNQDAVMQHLAEVGPLAVAVYASGWGAYRGGIYDGCKYSSNIALNHAVQLVGYGSDSDGDYYIVRNSWGSSWGEDGYIRLRRDSEAQCGTDSTPMDGTACADGPGSDEQHVCGQCGVLFDTSFPLGAHNWSMP